MRILLPNGCRTHRDGSSLLAMGSGFGLDFVDDLRDTPFLFVCWKVWFRQGDNVANGYRLWA